MERRRTPITWTIGEVTGWRPRKRGHDGKIAYVTPAEAERGAESLRAFKIEHGRPGVELVGIYPCRADGWLHWHVGHDRRREGGSDHESDQSGSEGI